MEFLNGKQGMTPELGIKEVKRQRKALPAAPNKDKRVKRKRTVLRIWNRVMVTLHTRIKSQTFPQESCTGNAKIASVPIIPLEVSLALRQLM
jgi:hypothetical protein